MECAGAIELRAWLGALAADGDSDLLLSETMTLPTIDAPPAPDPGAVQVLVHPCRADDLCTHGNVYVEAQGRLISAGDPVDEGVRALRDTLRDVQRRVANPADLKVAFVVDGRIPWGSLVPLIGAASSIDIRHLAFAFVAGTPHARAPGASSIDAELAVLDREEQAALDRDPAGTLSRSIDHPDPRPQQLAARVFEHCPGAAQVIAGIVHGSIASDDKEKTLAERVPDAVAACACKVEVTAVERLQWRLAGRDRSRGPFTWIAVELATTGDKVLADPTATWSSAHVEIVAAARRGRPIAIR
jgi:hypothetical protein